ncbi:MAG: hypothetical protein WC773_03765 [Patescibacteria group bacterium]|jgi:hypothetical protein
MQAKIVLIIVMVFLVAICGMTALDYSRHTGASLLEITVTGAEIESVGNGGTASSLSADKTVAHMAFVGDRCVTSLEVKPKDDLTTEYQVRITVIDQSGRNSSSRDFTMKPEDEGFNLEVRVFPPEPGQIRIVVAPPSID